MVDTMNLETSLAELGYAGFTQHNYFTGSW